MYRQQRDQIGALINPVNGFRGRQMQKGIIPKDHARENIRALRNAQNQNRAAKREESLPEAPLFKMDQFRNVQSKINAQPAESPELNDTATHASVATHRYMKKGEGRSAGKASQGTKKPGWTPGAIQGTDYVPESKRNLQGRSRRDPTPKASEVNQVAPRSKKDFVRQAREQLTNAKPKQVVDKAKEERRLLQQKRGQVPAYLRNRQAEWAREEEKRLRNAPDPSCPPGMRLMPEAERLETLTVLRRSQEAGKNQLSHLPLHIETPKMVQKKQALEAKLKEIEEALEIFNREKVYVQA